MQVLESNPNIGLSRIPNDLNAGERGRLAVMKSDLTADFQWFYTHDLGKERIDSDDPPNTPGDWSWREELLGNLEEVRMAYFDAFELIEVPGDPLTPGPTKAINTSADGMVGLLAVKELGQGVLEFFEWDVRREYWGQGIGGALLRMAAPLVPKGGTVIANIHEDNEPAKRRWGHYGLGRNWSVPPEEYGIIEGQHEQWHAPSDVFSERLSRERTYNSW